MRLPAGPPANILSLEPFFSVLFVSFVVKLLFVAVSFFRFQVRIGR